MKKTDSDAILNCAVELFREKGYKGTSMADIGNAAGLLKGSIYHHFKSKEDLLVASVHRLNAFFQEEVFAIAYEDSKPAVARLNAMLQIIEKYFNEYKACAIAHLALEDISHVPEADHSLRTFFKHWHGAFVHLFTEKYGKDIALACAEDAICSIEGAVIWLRLYGDNKPLARISAQIKSFL